MTNEQRVVECGGGVNEIRRCAGRTHAVSAGRSAAARPSRACRDRGIPRRGGTASLTYTMSTTLQWIMAELVKNPSIQAKLYDEIKVTVGDDHEGVSEEDTQKMPYLKAVILEGLRKHPPGHFALPHKAAEDMDVGGYLIPKGATVNLMVAEMGRDEREWENPMQFIPERFFAGGDGEGVDITGSKRIRMMPFAVGRRMCAGINTAMLHLEYFVANMVREFEWKAVAGDEVDFAEKFEFTTVMAKPLRAQLVRRSID
ncbi:hypothetical protein OsI_34306 [Oryza sativa Indica Group]|uniref:Cytochrome P450 n=1 Tax=Oryza sativa subsp. indica TaxID=39946 RepID=A2Z9B0_ORYSI|nr:hypothetical protein OsI_34306 [Oryza sativa Indica Group]